MKSITVSEFHAECKKQQMSRQFLSFKCPSCKTVQSAQSLIDAGAGDDFDAVQKFLGFSCIGRFTKKRGCDWSLGGLFKIHKLEVEDPEGKIHPHFEVATKEEAQKLKDSDLK